MGKLLKIVLVIVVVVVVLGGVALLSVDLIARKGLEAGGTAALGVDTSVRTVSIRLFDGIVGIAGLDLGNPEGFDSEYLARLDSGVVKANLRTLMSQVVEVDQILIEEPQFNLELKELVPPRSNLGVVLDHVQQQAEKLKPEEREKERQFDIQYVYIKNAKVRLTTPDGDATELTLPDIEMRELRNPDGSLLVMGDLLGMILASVGEASIKQADLPGTLGEALSKSLKSGKRMLAEVPEFFEEIIP